MKTINNRILGLMFVLLVSPLFANECSISSVQYKPYGSCDTQSRKCCKAGDGTWSSWSQSSPSCSCPSSCPEGSIRNSSIHSEEDGECCSAIDCNKSPQYPYCCNEQTPKNNTNCWTWKDRKSLSWKTTVNSYDRAASIYMPYMGSNICGRDYNCPGISDAESVIGLNLCSGQRSSGPGNSWISVSTNLIDTPCSSEGSAGCITVFEWTNCFYESSSRGYCHLSEEHLICTSEDNGYYEKNGW